MKTGSTKPLRRFTENKSLDPGKVGGISQDHPALREMRTIFPTTVVDAADSPRLLISGINQRKLGNRVVKGPWSGMPIFSLTLEERATCPSSCKVLAECYGNGMPFSRRHRAGTDLEDCLWTELQAKAKEHPNGFVIRLHVLGDFYSADYVSLWHRALVKLPQLHVFGYTAHEPKSQIGHFIASLNAVYSERWAIRFSGHEIGPQRAITLDFEPEYTTKGITVCPAQTGRTDCCGTCGLCWAPAAYKKTIAFVLHGQKWGRGRKVMAL